MMIENLAMQYLTGQLVVSYRTINRFRVDEGMEELIRNLFIDLNLRLKMEELVTLDCLFIDGTKIEANANKYSFVWKKATEKFSAKLQEQIQVYFQEEITPLIHQAIKLDEEEPISSEQLLVSYRTINRFRVAEGMEDLIRNLFIDLNLRLKMEELVTLDCLFIDGTKIEANANKYSFVWKKATEKFSAKLQEQIQVYFQEEITPLIHQAIKLDG